MDAALGARFGQRRSIESMLPRVPGSDAVAWSGWGAIPVDRAVTQDAAFELMEARNSLPGVKFEMGTVRQYKAGSTLAHILGFTGPIPQEALGEYLQRDYRIYDIVGRDGLEATYEHALRGDKGQRTVMVDVMGRVLNELRVEREPRPGDNLHLTVELSFQKAVEEALRNGLEASGARAALAGGQVGRLDGDRDRCVDV